MSDSEEKPSIIREIFIYDKPNKPAVPEDYLLKERVTLTSGDIILTRSKGSKARVKKVEHINEYPVKREPDEICHVEDQLADEFQETQAQETSNDIENVVDFANSLIDDILSNETPVEPIAVPNDIERIPEINVHSIPKRSYGKKQKGFLTEVIEKPLEKPQGDLLIESACGKPIALPIKSPRKKTVAEVDILDIPREVIEKSTDNSKVIVEKSPFKRPISPPSKPPQEVNSKDKAKVLNFFIKHPSLDVSVVAPVRDDLVYLIDDINEPERNDTRHKRTRKLPKRYDDDIMLEEVGYKSNIATKKPITKKKKLVVDEPTFSEGEELIEEFLPNVSDEFITDELVCGEEAFQSDDEDGPREWMPPEYADYKQEFETKQVLAVGKKFPCRICKINFDTYYGLRKHRAVFHGDSGRDQIETEAVVDDEIDEESSEELEIKDHETDQIQPSQNEMMKKTLFKCKICLLTFTNYYKLTRHRSEKHENTAKPYPCRECKKKFASLSTLTAHIRSVHQGKSPYECHRCKKGFQTIADLKAHAQVHILKKPEVIKKYRCDVCAKEFGKLSDIERHTRVHTGEKPAECHICHKRFQQPHNLTKHLLIHMQVKPFECEICHKKFGRIDVLNRHLLTHSVEKPFKCAFCQKSFIRQVQLSMHLDKAHPEADYGDVDDYEPQV